MSKQGGFVYENNTKCIGTWDTKGQLNGQGHILFPDGTRYDGNFTNGLFNGLGILAFPDGAKYEGEFLQGWYHGYGVFWRADGMHFEGEFRGGKLWGHGLITYADRTNGFPRNEGYFRDCNLIKKINCSKTIQKAQKVSFLARSNADCILVTKSSLSNLFNFIEKTVIMEIRVVYDGDDVRFGCDFLNFQIMVSTRGIKMKFFEGERVLCYEPDPTKAKVLYDSKVLEVVINKDNRGRKSVEYLIHFQGWNSSWDRCVSEEFVLKDTAENRQLQKDLADKSQLQLGAYLYRKEKKKHNKGKPGERTQSSEDGSSGSPAQLEMEDQFSSSEGDSSIEDDFVPIELSPDLLTILEHDHLCINEKNKLLKVPAEPTVVFILESYWKYYANSQIYGLSDKPHTRNRTPCVNNSKTKPEDLHKNLNICKEMLDGLRIYFDFTLNDLLLYKTERGQIETGQAKFLSIPTLTPSKSIKTEGEEADPSHEYENGQMENENHIRSTRRSGLRSSKNSEPDHTDTPTDQAKTSGSSNSEVNGPLSKLFTWKLLPEHVYSQPLPPPSLVYGATHLLRLFVKLPELLHNSNIAENKLKVLLKHFEMFLEFLSEHKEWFGEKHYTV